MEHAQMTQRIALRNFGFGRSIALILFATVLTSFLSAQQIDRAYELRLAKASQAAPSGAWGLERNDREARIADSTKSVEDRFLRRGKVLVKGSPTHSKEFNANKLRRAGVNIRDGEYELGAKWDFHHGTVDALGKIDILIPENSADAQSWDWDDQALYEIGRTAVPYIEAKQFVEATIENIAEEAIVERFLRRALFHPPASLVLGKDGLKVLPEMELDASGEETGKKRTPLERLKPFLTIPESRALLILGPSPVMFKKLESIGKNHFGDLEPSTARHRLWAKGLKEALEYLRYEIESSIYGRDKPLVRALRTGLPFNMQNSARWPMADQRLLRVGGLGAIKTLQLTRATNRAFAYKTDWLIKQIRERHAKKLVADFILLAKRGELDVDFFKAGAVAVKDKEGNPLFDAMAGIGPVDYLATIMLASEAVKDEVSLATATMTTLQNSDQDGDKAEAKFYGLAIQILNKAVADFADKFKAPSYSRAVRKLRSEPHLIEELSAKMRKLLSSKAAKQGELTKAQVDLANLTKLGVVENERILASRWESKLNWFRDMIVSRDRIAGRNAFIAASKKIAAERKLPLNANDYARLGQFGRIVINEAWAEDRGIKFDDLFEFPGMKKVENKETKVTHFTFFGDLRYGEIREMQAPIFKELSKKGVIERDGGAVTFFGDQQNDGRIYDYQNDVVHKGLSIELVSDDNTRRTFKVQPGRSYVFSFEYMTSGLDGTKAWVEFVPLNEHGLAIGPDGRALTSVFEKGEGSNAELGKFVAFPFSDTSSKGKMLSSMFTGSTPLVRSNGQTSPGFKTAGFRLVAVPDPVQGFTIEIKVDSLFGEGEVAFRNFKLQLVENYFSEGFEEPTFGKTSVGELERPNSKNPLENGVWQRVTNEAENYMPWSAISYNDQERYSGKRSLDIQPKGFNVRLETSEFFHLNSDRSYIFRGRLNTKDMEGMEAWFEVLLYDQNRQPVTIDGIPVAEGQNVYRTPKRSDSSSKLLWESLTAPNRWFSEEVVLDDISAADLEVKDPRNLAIDSRKRLGIAFARIAIVVSGRKPAYSARVLVDDLELHESPKVHVKLRQIESKATDSLFGDDEDSDSGNLEEHNARDFLELKDWDESMPYTLEIGLEVAGLVPNRVGYHYTLDLYDYTGKMINAADTIGGAALDKAVQSDGSGGIGPKEFGYINLDELGVTNRFGFFLAHFKLSYKDDTKPVIERSYKIGFMPSPLRKAQTPGDFGVVLDLNSSKQRWIDQRLKHLDVGRVIVPITNSDMARDGSDYNRNQMLQDYDYLMRFMPNVSRSAMLGPLPKRFDEIYALGDADEVFSDTKRDEWKELVSAIHERWQDRFDDYVVGDVAEKSFTKFTSHAASALDNIEGEFAGNRVEWAERFLPLTLASGAEQRVALESLVKSFEKRWGRSLQAQTQGTRDAISAALTPDDERKIREALPARLWMKKNERFSFFVPANLSVDEMESSINEYLARIARYEDVLGDDSQTALTNARALIAGGAVDFDALLDRRAIAEEHSIVIDIQQVPTENYAAQLRDMIVKIARAKELGFKRINVSRLRNTGSDDLPDGLMTRGNLAQPGFFAFRTLNAVLSERVYEPLTLNMQSNNRYAFFRNPQDRSLTFVLYSDDKEDAVEDLPFGNDARLVDVMGNTTALISEPSSEGTPSGMVRLHSPAGSLPLIVTGIDNTLLDVVQSLTIDNPTIEASSTDQTRRLTMTNSFNSRVTVNVSLPLNSSVKGKRNISSDAVLKTTTGVISGAAAKSFDFESRDLGSGESANFDFVLSPRSTMGIGERYLPVRVLVKGRNVYEFQQRLRLNVVSQLSVTETTAIDPGNKRGLEMIFKIATARNNGQTLSGTLSLPDHPKVRARVYDFGLQPQSDFDVPFTLPYVPKSKQEGLRVALSVREKGGSDFLNMVYRVTIDPESRALFLVREEDYVAP